MALTIWPWLHWLAWNCRLQPGCTQNTEIHLFHFLSTGSKGVCYHAPKIIFNEICLLSYLNLLIETVFMQNIGLKKNPPYSKG